MITFVMQVLGTYLIVEYLDPWAYKSTAIYSGTDSWILLHPKRNRDSLGTGFLGSRCRSHEVLRV